MLSGFRLCFDYEINRHCYYFKNCSSATLFSYVALFHLYDLFFRNHRNASVTNYRSFIQLWAVEM